MQKVKHLPKDAHITINTIILHVPLPAIALLSIPVIEWNFSLISLCFVPWIIWWLSFFLFKGLGKRLSWDKEIIGCLILTSGLGNTAFVGFPIVEALYGKEALKHAILIDQPGTFLIVSSFGIWLSALYSSGGISKTEMAKRIFLFPPFVASLTAAFLALIGWSAQDEIKGVLEKLAGTLTPLALISVGLQLKWRSISTDLKYLSIGLGYKLFFAPLIIFIIYQFLNIPKDVFQVAVIESAMAPMITASILAASHQLRPTLAGLMVGVGVPVSFITLSIWYFVLKFF